MYYNGNSMLRLYLLHQYQLIVIYVAYWMITKTLVIDKVINCTFKNDSDYVSKNRQECETFKLFTKLITGSTIVNSCAQSQRLTYLKMFIKASQKKELIEKATKCFEISQRR